MRLAIALTIGDFERRGPRWCGVPVSVTSRVSTTAAYQDNSRLEPGRRGVRSLSPTRGFTPARLRAQ